MRKFLPFLFLIAGLSAVAHGALAAQDTYSSKEQENRDLILRFYKEPDHVKRLAFLADGYKQHTPMIADGKEGIKAFFEQSQRENPHLEQHIVRMAVDGDFVWVHLHTIPKPGDRGIAVINIFRIADGKIAEHWDVIQPVAEKAENKNSMF